MEDKHSSEAEFDIHAEGYEADLKASLPELLAEGDYFARYKVEAVYAAEKRRDPRAILDFGCGVGLALQIFSEYFPKESLWGYDVSPVSLSHARQRAPTAQLTADLHDLQENYFDVIFVANVFHHIPIDTRLSVMKACRAMLKPGGRIYLFEHNPYNPLTRRVFERCPFDRDAQMITRGALLELTALADLTVVAKRYTLFFPKPLAVFRRMEFLLGWLPIGAQYCVELAK
jgi:SAM-dependent methyltransferase